MMTVSVNELIVSLIEAAEKAETFHFSAVYEVGSIKLDLEEFPRGHGEYEVKVGCASGEFIGVTVDIDD